MIRTKSRSKLRGTRHASLRRKITGTAERPRLAVFRSARHIYAQIIDDVTGRTLASASSLDPDLTGAPSGSKSARAADVGKLLAARAKERNISQVVFDRGGHKYHGRVAALADAARKGGLEL